MVTINTVAQPFVPGQFGSFFPLLFLSKAIFHWKNRTTTKHRIMAAAILHKQFRNHFQMAVPRLLKWICSFFFLTSWSFKAVSLTHHWEAFIPLPSLFSPKTPSVPSLLLSFPPSLPFLPSLQPTSRVLAWYEKGPNWLSNYQFSQFLLGRFLSWKHIKFHIYVPQSRFAAHRLPI